jgi:leader peptidase (prepilin peptidase)/N-methyltransferase
VNVVTSLYTAVTGAGFGAAFGSYAGVVRARGWGASLRGRSRCDSCGRTLRWFELVPIVSYVVLRRRCRACGGPIGWEPFLVEIAGAALGAAAGLALLAAVTR